MFQWLHVAMLDGNADDMDQYSALCKRIGKQLRYLVDIREYRNADSFLFDMEDRAVLHAIDIVITDPQNGGARVVVRLRDMGYKGLILYLTRAEDVSLSMQAFDSGVFNYLKKGEEHLKRFRHVFEQALAKAEEMKSSYILLKNREDCVRLALRDIYYFTVYNHMVTAHHSTGVFRARGSITELARRLEEYGYVQTHQSYLVQIDSIACVKRESIRLTNGAELPVSRTFQRLLKEKSVIGNLAIVGENHALRI